MKSIGIKLADGSFYPILKEGSAETKDLELTTVKDNQTKVQIDLYRSETNSMEDAEYVDSLEITNLNPHPNGVPSLSLQLNLDSDNKLHAQMKDPETGKFSKTQVSLISRTLEEREAPANFALNDAEDDLMPGVSAVSSILTSPNDEEFSFDPISDIPDISDDLDDLEDTTLDLDSLDVDSIEEAQISDDFMTDAQVIDDDIVSEKPLTDADMLTENPFADDDSADDDDMFVDKDGTGFSFSDDSDTEPEEPIAPAEPETEKEDFQIPSSLLDSSLFDESLNASLSAEQKTEVDTNIELPDFGDFEADLGLDDLEEPTLSDNLAVPEELAEPETDNFEFPEPDISSQPEETATEDFALPEISEPEPQENETEVVEKTVTEEPNPYDLPDFDDLETETISETEITPEPESIQEPKLEVPESNFDFSLPNFDELDTSNTDSLSDSLNDFTVPETTEETTETDQDDDLDLPNIEESFTNDSIEKETASADSNFSLDDLDLPDFGDDDSVDTEAFAPKNLPEDSAETTEDNSSNDFGLPPLVTDTDLPSSDNFAETTANDSDSSFDIDDMDLPDFNELDKTDIATSKIPTDFPDFDDPFASLTSPTANTDFEYPEFDDSPTKMELESDYQDSATKEIFGDFDDTDAVFEGDTDGFTDPTKNKKKFKKSKAKHNAYGSYSELDDDKEEKDNRKLVPILLVALLACLIVILVLVLQSKGPKNKNNVGQEIAQVPSKGTTELVTSMGEPRTENSESITVPAEQNKTVEEKNTASENSTSTANTQNTTVNNSASSVTKTETSSATTNEPPVKRPVIETAKKIEGQAPVIIPAKEDTIIVAVNPEAVVPREKNPTSGNTSDIKYTVVWGDTLWDISTAYYKTPYRYNRIADYNGITDANRIKSGQVLLIPAE